VHVYEHSIKPCTGCGHCREKRECIFDDDMTQIYSQIENARLISISSPVYFSSLPAPLKALIDRCQLLWELYRREPDAGRKKTGIFISAAGSRYHNIFLPSVTIIRHFFNSTGIYYLENDFLLCPEMEMPEGIAAFERYLDSARELGRLYRQRLTANKFV